MPLHSYGSFYIYCDMLLYLKKKLVNYTRDGVVMVIIFIQLSFPNKFTTFSANTLLSDTTKENFFFHFRVTGVALQNLNKSLLASLADLYHT